MSWISKAVKKVGSVVKKIAKPIEKIVGPIIKNTIDSIPGVGAALVATHDTIKRNIWDPLRRGDSDVVTEIKEAFSQGIGGVAQAAVAGARAGVTVQQANLQARNAFTNASPMMVLGVAAIAMLALGFGKRR